MIVKVVKELDVYLSVEDLAQAFCNLDNDLQAKFFCACARIADNWPAGNNGEVQWLHVGSHLATCECATEGGREMVRSIVYGVDNPFESDVKRSQQ